MVSIDTHFLGFSMKDSVQCWIYKSNKKEEMYLYMSQEDHFDDLPSELITMFGAPSFVMELALTPDKKLAKENSITVIQNLEQQGFHLQLPPDLKPDLYHGNED